MLRCNLRIEPLSLKYEKIAMSSSTFIKDNELLNYTAIGLLGKFYEVFLYYYNNISPKENLVIVKQEL